MHLLPFMLIHDFQLKFWMHFLAIPRTILATPSSLPLIGPPLLHLVKNTNYGTHHYAVFFVFILLPAPIKFQYSLSILFSVSICIFSSRWDQVGRCSSHILYLYSECALSESQSWHSLSVGDFLFSLIILSFFSVLQANTRIKFQLNCNLF
jgi:hypothetical protein